MPEKMYKSGDALKREIAHTRPPFPMTAIWYLGGSSICIKTSKHLYLFDPVFHCADDGEVLPFKPEDSSGIDYVFLCNYHSMAQIQSLRELAAASDRTQFIVPAPHVQSFAGAGLPADRVYGAKSLWYFALEGAQVVPVAEDAGSEEEGRRLGYTIRVPGMVLYHSANRERIMDPSVNFADLGIDVLSCVPGKDTGEFCRRTGCDLVLPMYSEYSGAMEIKGYPENISCRCHELLAGERYFYQK